MVRFAAMASMKNTIVLGCFILAGFGFQTWMQLEHSDRYESVVLHDKTDEGTESPTFMRFDKWTGIYEYELFGKEWREIDVSTKPGTQSE